MPRSIPPCSSLGMLMSMVLSMMLHVMLSMAMMLNMMLVMMLHMRRLRLHLHHLYRPWCRCCCVITTYYCKT